MKLETFDRLQRSNLNISRVLHDAIYSCLPSPNFTSIFGFHQQNWWFEIVVESMKKKTTSGIYWKSRSNILFQPHFAAAGTIYKNRVFLASFIASSALSIFYCPFSPILFTLFSRCSFALFLLHSFAFRPSSQIDIFRESHSWFLVNHRIKKNHAITRYLWMYLRIESFWIPIQVLNCVYCYSTTVQKMNEHGAEKLGFWSAMAMKMGGGER